MEEQPAVENAVTAIRTTQVSQRRDMVGISQGQQDNQRSGPCLGNRK